jgi:hypothetical protein
VCSSTMETILIGRPVKRSGLREATRQIITDEDAANNRLGVTSYVSSSVCASDGPGHSVCPRR